MPLLLAWSINAYPQLTLLWAVRFTSCHLSRVMRKYIWVLKSLTVSLAHLKHSQSWISLVILTPHIVHSKSWISLLTLTLNIVIFLTSRLPGPWTFLCIVHRRKHPLVIPPLANCHPVLLRAKPTLMMPWCTQPTPFVHHWTPSTHFSVTLITPHHLL